MLGLKRKAESPPSGGCGGDQTAASFAEMTRLLTAQLGAAAAALPVASDAGSAAAPARAQGCMSCLQGPRDFPAHMVPTKICSSWQRHPALCLKGDNCLLAHGLMEMGLDVATAVRMQSSSDETPIDVQIVNPDGSIQPVAPTLPELSVARQLTAAEALGQVMGANGIASPLNVGAAPGNLSSLVGTSPAATMAAIAALSNTGGLGGAAPGGAVTPAVPLLGGAVGGNYGSPGGASGGYMKTRICTFLPNCHRGASCTYAHSPAELGMPQPKNIPTGPFLKKQMCSFFVQGGCDKGEFCSYAHDESEIGTPQPKGGGKGAGVGEPFMGMLGKGGDPDMMAHIAATLSKGADVGKGKGKGSKGKDDIFARLGPSRYKPGEEMNMPFRLCESWLSDPATCQRGADCEFAHGVRELAPTARQTCGVSRFLHTGWKPTQVCNFFLEGSCERGVNCTFAHGPEDAM